MKTLRLHYITTSVYYTDVILFSDFIRYDPLSQCPGEIHAGEYPGEEHGNKTKKN